MTFSLHAAIIPSKLQILDALTLLLDKGEVFGAERQISEEDMLQTRLAPDMHPFAYQVKSAAVHSIGAIEGVRQGVFAPDQTTPPASFAALRERIGQAHEALRAVEPAEVDSWIGRAMRFEIGDRRMDFTAEEFLLSFSQPNFYFHATTAYDIFRMKGVALGKRDFLGKLRLAA